ncbi:TonB-dependent receptor [Saccharobesus litoralis]|uniref:TonB-dependent receptor n=1 Tax=Saccharobesus litoralis TaxID=2172099 RepID=A0A2S0VUR7_9ALTE|nr:TonB-dependent receptor [Saccharobesus litoralis]AWB67967.1 TonB-dependent receptor [Saccharobesus litoralis]
MSVNFKLKPIALAMMPILFAGTTTLALAAEEDDKKKQEEAETEVIEVTGFKASVQKALNSKRFSDTISDSIHAEDIGKSTDQNIADALSRVTGIAIQTEDGEGTKITVRGANPNLNQISLNGVALTSGVNDASGGNASVDQSVDLSTISSDILSSINVVKTPAADHDEGSLGANVILRTVKPLNINKDKRIVEIQGRYNEFSEDANRKFSATFSKKLLDETFGFIVTVADETQSTRKDQLSGDWLSPYVPVFVKDGGATSLQTGEPTSGESMAIMRKTLGYGVDLNQRDRVSANLGLQFAPAETTDIQLDLSYSKQTLQYNNHGISVSNPQQLIAPKSTDVNAQWEGTGDDRDIVAYDNQADWWTLDEENKILVKSLNRVSTGAMRRTLGGNETENKVASLTIHQQLTDDLTVDIRAGYAQTYYESLPNWTISTNNWNLMPVTTKQNIPVGEVEPVGYDCTGGTCQMSVSTTPITYVPGGVNNNQSNIVKGGFIPYDPHANHLGYTAQYDNEQTDTNKSIFVDFDWDVDFGPVTKLEFGAKWSNRVKDVYTNFLQVKDGDSEIRFDQVTGQPIQGRSPVSIRMSDILDPTDSGKFAFTDFMGDLTDNKLDENGQPLYSTDFLQGWGVLDPIKTYQEIFDVPNSELTENDKASRIIELDNHSLYGKVNFEFFDQRLTGNLGLRYVKTDVNSSGFAEIKYHDKANVFDQTAMFFDLQLVNQQLGDCPYVREGTSPWKNQGVRIDGVTVDNVDPDGDGIIGSPNGATWTNADGSTGQNYYPCFEQGDPEGGGFLVKDNGLLNIPFDDQGQPLDRSLWVNEVDSSRGPWPLYRHGDITTQKQYSKAIGELYGIDPKQVYERGYQATGEGSTSILLPSLNLNYAINDQFIARFAASKTMARPRFDSMRPGFSINESTWWTSPHRATVYNPGLQPLESENLDLSLEWYFNESGLISLALFDKQMTNFEESVKDHFYYKDLRTDYTKTDISWAEIAMPADGVDSLTNTECMPHRIIQDALRQPITFECADLLTTVIRNGKGATSQGLEFSYSQSYDFLPGVLSGLGATFNYTYAESESHIEELSGSGKLLQPLPQQYTPLHSANATIYWEKNGHQLRLANRYSGVQLLNRGLNVGAEWKDATNNLDFSASYKFNKNLTLSFHALNLTDEVSRTFFTSTNMVLDYSRNDAGNYINEAGDVIALDDGTPAMLSQILSDGDMTKQLQPIELNEGNAMTDNVDKSRTIREWKTGRQFRLSARFTF